MQFNPHRNKPAQELYFSKKAGNQKSLDLTFNKSNVASSPSVKHLGMLLDSRLNFNKHVQSKTNKCYKIMDLSKNYQYTYQEKHYFGFISHLSDLTWTTAI